MLKTYKTTNTGALDYQALAMRYSTHGKKQINAGPLPRGQRGGWLFGHIPSVWVGRRVNVRRAGN